MPPASWRPWTLPRPERRARKPFGARLGVGAGQLLIRASASRETSSRCPLMKIRLRHHVKLMPCLLGRNLRQESALTDAPAGLVVAALLLLKADLVDAALLRGASRVLCNVLEDYVPGSFASLGRLALAVARLVPERSRDTAPCPRTPQTAPVPRCRKPANRVWGKGSSPSGSSGVLSRLSRRRYRRA